jgi:hypothetical protein
MENATYARDPLRSVGMSRRDFMASATRVARRYASR